MHIVILDGYTLNPGDLKWEPLKRFGTVTIYERTDPQELLSRCKNADAILLNKVPFHAGIINQLPQLKYIGVLATGYNIVDVEAAKARGIKVTNAPGYGTASVVQMTFALLMELCLHVQRHADTVKEGKWSRCQDFCYWDFPLIELSGKTMGILGFGTIGRQVGQVAAAFGMKVIAPSRNNQEQPKYGNFNWVSLPELLTKSDVLSIHCPLTPDTRGFINSDNLQQMKRSSFLINTSRGPVVNDIDLADALNNGTIAGAGLDVLSVEPPSINNPLLNAKNCLITPHIAWATKEARGRLMDIATNNLLSFIEGRPGNVVNE